MLVVNRAAVTVQEETARALRKRLNKAASKPLDKGAGW